MVVLRWLVPFILAILVSLVSGRDNDQERLAEPQRFLRSTTDLPTLAASTALPTMSTTSYAPTMSSEPTTSPRTFTPSVSPTLSVNDKDLPDPLEASASPAPTPLPPSPPAFSISWAIAFMSLSFSLAAMTWRKRAGDLLCCHENIVPDEIIVRRHNPPAADIELMPVSTFEASRTSFEEDSSSSLEGTYMQMLDDSSSSFH